jgi:thioredoxin-related protein
MRKFMLASFAVALVAGLLQPALAEEGWLVDFKAAQEKAAAEGKEILMEFTGSDWCPPCIALHDKVLVTDEFKTKAPEHFILLKLDTPRDKSKQTPEEIEQYKKLSAEYKISGVPTIILADKTGKPFAKFLGYGGQEAEEYVKNLTEKKANRAKRDEILAKADKASGVDKAKLLDEAVAIVEDNDLAVAKYRDLVDEIVKLDAENAGGLKKKYESLVKLDEIRTALKEITIAAGADVAGALPKIDELIDAKQPEGEVLQEVLYRKAQLQMRTDKAAAKATMEAALEAAPASRMAAQIKLVLETQFKEPGTVDL